MAHIIKENIEKLVNLYQKILKKIPPSAFNIPSPRETGKTFKENSLLKVNYFYKKSKEVSISDDSGLEIVALKKSTRNLLS